MSLVRASLFSARQTRRVWLERLVIPRFERPDGSIGRTNGLKHFLRVIESHSGTGGKCCLNASTIAHEMGITERTVFRHLADAKQLGLLVVEPANGSASWYEIDWQAVGQFILDCPETTSLIDRSSEYRMRKAGTQQGVGTPDNLARTPDNLATADAGRTYSSRARALKPCINHEIKPSCRNDDLEGDGGKRGGVQGGASAGSRVLSPPPLVPPSPSTFSGWPFLITREHLSTPSIVQQLWEHAIERGYCEHHQRVNFFVLALCISGKTDVHNAGGKFTAQLKQSVATGNWLGTNDQEQRVIRAIRRIDSQGVTA